MDAGINAQTSYPSVDGIHHLIEDYLQVLGIEERAQQQHLAKRIQNRITLDLDTKREASAEALAVEETQALLDDWLRRSLDEDQAVNLPMLKSLVLQNQFPNWQQTWVQDQRLPFDQLDMSLWQPTPEIAPLEMSEQTIDLYGYGLRQRLGNRLRRLFRAE